MTTTITDRTDQIAPQIADTGHLIRSGLTTTQESSLCTSSVGDYRLLSQDLHLEGSIGKDKSLSRR